VSERGTSSRCAYELAVLTRIGSPRRAASRRSCDRTAVPDGPSLQPQSQERPSCHRSAVCNRETSGPRTARVRNSLRNRKACSRRETARSRELAARIASTKAAVIAPSSPLVS